MAEWSLEEQLARIRMLADQLSEATKSVSDVSDELTRFRASVDRGPLFDVRDYRVCPPEQLTAASPESADSESRDPAGPSTSRDSSPRRRRR
jgi:hypothetical protein